MAHIIKDGKGIKWVKLPEKNGSKHAKWISRSEISQAGRIAGVNAEIWILGYPIWIRI